MNAQETAHPQNISYQRRIERLQEFANTLRREGRPILKKTLVRFALKELKVSERTAKTYANSVIEILETGE